MERYVFRFTGIGPPPAAQTLLIRQRYKVIDESPRMLLIEAEPGDINQFAASLPGWQSSREVKYRAPEPPLAVRERPKG